MEKEFKGQCKGVRLQKRGVNDNHICVQILTEDDENWFESGHQFSSYWIDELIQKLKEAKAYMRTQKKDESGYGYVFKK